MGEADETRADDEFKRFVWLRFYQALMGLVPCGRRQPLRWTLRRPFRPLTYHAAHRMFERAAATAGSGRRSIRCAPGRAEPLTVIFHGKTRQSGGRDKGRTAARRASVRA